MKIWDCGNKVFLFILVFINNSMNNINKILNIFEHELGTFDEVDNLSTQSYDVPLFYKQPDIKIKNKKRRFKRKLFNV